MKLVVILVCCFLALSSCRHSEEPENEAAEPEPTLVSQDLAGNFPLLPLIEKQLWQDLLKAEQTASNAHASEPQRAAATAQIKTIADQLQKKHPFTSKENHITLGGIRYDKKSRVIKIPAVVCYPKEGDKRHPGELELILCSNTGRSHETLFVSKTQPLHLELLMHLAGFKKTSPVSLFRVDVSAPHQPPIPIEKLIRPAAGDKLPSPMIWEFSGGDFNDLYSPDLTGDFIICWHAHPSVLRIHDEKIASGEIKLFAKKHTHLTQGMAVTLVLSPIVNRYDGHANAVD